MEEVCPQTGPIGEQGAFLAHITEDGTKFETVEQHLERTAVLASQFAGAFGSAEQGRLAGLAHDIGKYSEAFQRRLRGSAEQVDHSTAGAYECSRIGQAPAAFAVMGHHGGLPDGGGKGDIDEAGTFMARLKKARNGKIEPYDAWGGQLPSDSPIPEFAQSDKRSVMFYTRMLYSCLVDADYLATEEFFTGEKRHSDVGGMVELGEKLSAYTSRWYPPCGGLNIQRCRILDRCEAAGKESEPGLRSLTVPTGGGKTVASLAYALAHAVRNGLRRVVYVIPYTSIIDQTARTFREILGEDVVLEHHSGVDYDITSESTPREIRLARATENWDMPVVVTTAVQFFESLFANKPSKCRKLHNLANSVIIFDEAQMLPVPYLRPCVWAMTELVARYGVSALLCTATQPALASVVREFSSMEIQELCPSGTFDPSVFRRVSFRRLPKALSSEDLANEMSRDRQALCIVNSRAGAQELFNKLDGESVFHLSTLMCPAHRLRVLDEIRGRLSEGLPCKVVSTSLIEAGIDVDFPKVYREMAGLDSILQAAGRCNREGRRPCGESVVELFESEREAPPLFSLPIACARDVVDKFDDFASNEAIEKYFCELFHLKGEDALDRKEILRLMEGNFPFEAIAGKFRLIDSPTRTIYIPLGEGAGLVERLKNGERGRGLLRKLGLFGVEVYSKHFDSLFGSGAVECLDDGKAYLADISLYSNKTGLSLVCDSGRGLFV